MREHVDRLNLHHAVAGSGKHGEIAGKRSRIAGYVDNPLRSNSPCEQSECPFGTSFSRRIENYDLEVLIVGKLLECRFHLTRHIAAACDLILLECFNAVADRLRVFFHCNDAMSSLA